MKYKKIEKIGSGFYSEVSKVIDTKGNIYALKEFLLPEYLNELAKYDSVTSEDKANLIKRFKKEINIQSNFKHPYIMPIIDYDLTIEHPYYIMPLAEKDFESEIKEMKESGEIVLSAIYQVLSGLEEIHKLGYVHRDIKPQNILYVEDKWVISDFGLVLDVNNSGSKLTHTKSKYGTELYAAPEQYTDFHNVTPEADIFSVGCILDDIYSNKARLPYQTVSSDDSIGPMASVIRKCTEQNYENRFHSSSSLIKAINISSGVPYKSETPEINDWLSKLSNSENEITIQDWEKIIRYAGQNYIYNPKNTKYMDAYNILSNIDEVHFSKLKEMNKLLYKKLLNIYVEWIKNSSFQFDFCDMLGYRLIAIYKNGDVNDKAITCIAALNLGESHNRYQVMRYFYTMAGKVIEDDLAKRISIELLEDVYKSKTKINRLVKAIELKIENLHPSIQDVISNPDGT